MALIGHLRVANECRVALATLTAASSGPIPKAPGSAGGYLLIPVISNIAAASEIAQIVCVGKKARAFRTDPEFE